MYENIALRLLNGQQEGETSPLPANPVVTMAYVPMQRWNQVYDMSRGLTRGTIFPELDLPFVMGRCR